MNTQLKEKMQREAKKLRAEFSSKYGAGSNLTAGDVAVWIQETFEEGASAMYSELAPLVEWVGVEDKKPTSDTVVLIKVKHFLNHIVIVALYSAEESKWFTNLFHDEIKLEVTHWRRIDL